MRQFMFQIALARECDAHRTWVFKNAGDETIREILERNIVKLGFLVPSEGS